MWKKIKNWFSKHFGSGTVVQNPPSSSVGTTPSASVPTTPIGKMTKVALVVGHEKKAKGASSHDKKTNEYDYFSIVAERVKMLSSAYPNAVVQVFYRDGFSIAGTINNAANWGADIIIELHYNAYNRSAKGAEILSAIKNPLGEQFLSGWCAHANLVNRGVKVIDRGNGFSSVNQIRIKGAKGFLFEAFFGDNPSDWRDHDVLVNYFLKWLQGLK